jgi:hypothetical protein
MIDRDANRSVWEQRLADFEGCEGVTVKDWCKKNGFSDSGFRYWRNKIKQEKVEAGVPTFMPMKVTQETAATSGSSMATLQIGDVIVNVPASFDESALRKLLNVVKSIC